MREQRTGDSGQRTARWVGLLAVVAAMASGQSAVVRDGCAAATASGTAYACNYAVSPGLIANHNYSFQADVANTGSATINFNSLGAKTMKKWVSGSLTNLAANDIGAGQWVSLYYDGTAMQVVSLGGGGGGGGGGSVFTGSTGSTVGSSATPVFSLADVSVKSPIVFTISPTVNVTGPTITNKVAGARFEIRITTDGTHTWTWNGIVSDGVCQPYTDAAATTTAGFVIDPDGSTVHGIPSECSVSIGGVLFLGGAVAASGVTPTTSGNEDCRAVLLAGIDCLGSDGVHRIAVPRGQGGQLCPDSSGSGTTQVCSTGQSFTPADGDKITYKTTTANSGDVTVNVNAAGAVHVRKWLGSATLASGDLPANTPVTMIYHAAGPYWEITTIGNAPSGGGGGSGNYGCSVPTLTGVVLNGTPQALSSCSSVVLAAGKCLEIQAIVAYSTGNSSTITLDIDGTAIFTIEAGPVNAGSWYRFAYCNNPGVQNAQTMFGLGGGGYNSSAGLGAGTALTNLLWVGVPTTPTAVNWSSSHTVAFYGSTSGTQTATPYYLSVVELPN